MEQLLEGLFTAHPLNFLLLMVFGLLGANLNLGWSYLQRGKDGRTAPADFSIRYMFTDNWLRMLISLGFIYVAERFGHGFMISLLPLGPDALIFGSDEQLQVAFAIGWSADLLPHLLRNKLRPKVSKDQ